MNVLRNYNGLDFVSEKFNEFFKKQGTKRDKIVVRTPKPNGLIEHMNITILERVRRMLQRIRLPKIFWSEVIATLHNLIDRCPST